MNVIRKTYKALFAFILVFLIFCPFAYTQSDSLRTVWESDTKEDAVRLEALYNLIWTDFLFSNKDSTLQYTSEMQSFAEQKGLKKYQALSYKLRGICYTINAENDLAIESYQKGLLIFQEIKDSKGVANTYNNIGMLYKNISEYYLALDNYNLSLAIEKKEGNKAGIADVLGNIGSIYHLQGIYPLALECHQKSLQLRIDIDDKTGMAKSTNNIGNISFESGDFDKAIENYLESLKIFEVLEDVQSISTCYNNIGNVYYIQKKFELALEYYQKCLNINSETSNKNGEAAAFLNIALVHKEQGKFEMAIEEVKKSMEIRLAIDDKKGVAMTQYNLAQLYFNLNQYGKAFENAKSALTIAEKVGSLSDIKESAALLYRLNRQQKNYQSALEMYELFVQTRDSMFNEANTKKIIQQQYQFEYDKKAAADSVILKEKMKVKNAEITASNAEAAKQRLASESQKKQNAYLFGVLALVGLFGVFIFNRYKVTKRQKNVIDQQKFAVESQKIKIEKQHQILEETHKEITDSIKYAKRIQAAILPPEKLVKEYLKESFILYKPKDIVAGDFYWMERQGDTTFFAAADCTGHGVPGAMVSVVCNNGLNRSVREFGLSDPGEILDKTRELVIQEFEKSEEEVKDGMDISLCSLTGNVLNWAGANNPLWIVRDNELIEYKADKQPIGKYTSPKPFTSHKIALNKDDVVYLFSDGFSDQFGGPKGKKYMAAKFKKLLISIHKKPMNQQKDLLETAFENWKNKEEQLDDVCIIGVRI